MLRINKRSLVRSRFHFKLSTAKHLKRENSLSLVGEERKFHWNRNLPLSSAHAEMKSRCPRPSSLLFCGYYRGGSTQAPFASIQCLFPIRWGLNLCLWLQFTDEYLWKYSSECQVKKITWCITRRSFVQCKKCSRSIETRKVRNSQMKTL